MFIITKESSGALQTLPKDENKNISLILSQKIKITSDTYIFRFKFPDESVNFGLPIGNHVIFSAQVKTKEHPEGELIQRKYTPMSTLTQNGYVDFVIKIYRANVHPRFPEGGVMTQYLETLVENQSIMLMEGPKGRLAYQGMGRFLIGKQQLRKTKIGLVAGGTGITPCYQVIQAALDYQQDGTQLSLIFGNRTVDDILLRKELESYSQNNPKRFKLHLTVDVKPEVSESWEGSVGFITQEMLRQNMPEASPETIILYCGPPPFEEMMAKHLKALGYASDMIFKF
eukprot:403347109